jgi:hypothetical protein
MGVMRRILVLQITQVLNSRIKTTIFERHCIDRHDQENPGQRQRYPKRISYLFLL